MYQLTQKCLSLLSEDLKLRLKVALKMGITEQGVIRSMGRNQGVSIATNYDAIQEIISLTGFDIAQIREEIKEQTATA